MPGEPARCRTVVFDLDDTLYAERDYVTSGVKAVLATVHRLYGIHIAAESLPSNGAIDEICRRIGLADSVRIALLWVYRLHHPVISPRPGAREAIAECRRRGEAVCILTDGRSTSQRLKLDALGLDHDAAFVSEELGCEKPSHLGFARIEAEFPARSYVYVADNPVKDFIAPNARGWQTIGLRAAENAIHPQRLDILPVGAPPHKWVNDFGEIDAMLTANAISPPRSDTNRVSGM